MRSIAWLALAVMALCGPAFAGQVYHADPKKGTPDGDGSAAKPWTTLEQVVKSGKLKQLKGGDTLLLGDGYHGAVSFSGDNDSMVTIAAEPGARPELSRLTIGSGTNWDLKGLVISPSFGPAPYKDFIVTFGEGGPSSKITIEDCYVFTVQDASKWGAKEWIGANNGINMGRNGKDLTLRNNYVRNTRFGISLCAYDSLCEGNVVSDFSGDAMRATRDGEVVQYNIMKNCYVSAADGDANHDDGLQVFLFNKGTGTVRNIKTIGNIIIAHENPQQKLQNALQGLGFFDGPLVDFVVRDNVVNVDSYHGISLYDAQNAIVDDNVVWTPPGRKMRAWIMFGTKPRSGGADANEAKDNFAPTFNLKAPGTVQANNKPATEAIYEQALKRQYKVICDKFGEKHFAANCQRMELK